MDQLMARVARLDHDLVYWGLSDPKPVDELQGGDVVFGPDEVRSALPIGARYVGADCDLAGGLYKWDAELGTFHLLPRASRKQAEESPTLEQAFYDLVTKGRDSSRLQAWVQWYEKTMDKNVDGGQR